MKGRSLIEIDRLINSSGVLRSVSFGGRSWVYTLFIESCISNGLVFHNDFHWTSGEENLEKVTEVVPEFAAYAQDRYDGKTLTILGEDFNLLLHLRKQNVNVTIARKAGAPVPERLVVTLKEVLPPAKAMTKNLVPFTFWSASRDGANFISRDITVPTWDEIEGNYPGNTRRALERTMKEFVPSSGGQLVLLHGEPGVGKTYAIRSLSSAWLDWCAFEYIMDPEEFFGNSSYMMEVLTHDEDDEPEYRGKDARKWRVLVLEDAGELLTADAKERTGQGLSRMLNVTDGLIGQGLQILVLITTNEPLRKVNPSVARPGRCAVEIEFDRFGKAEADEWLRAKGIESPSVSSRTISLAELYNLLDDKRIIARHESKVGLV